MKNKEILESEIVEGLRKALEGAHAFADLWRGHSDRPQALVSSLLKALDLASSRDWWGCAHAIGDIRPVRDEMSELIKGLDFPSARRRNRLLLSRSSTHEAMSALVDLLCPHPYARIYELQAALRCNITD